MLISAEMSVVLTLGSPKRLNSSRVTSRIRSAVRRGFFLVRSVLAMGRDSGIGPGRGCCLQSRAHAAFIAVALVLVAQFVASYAANHVACRQLSQHQQGLFECARAFAGAR